MTKQRERESERISSVWEVSNERFIKPGTLLEINENLYVNLWRRKKQQQNDVPPLLLSYFSWKYILKWYLLSFAVVVFVVAAADECI